MYLMFGILSFLTALTLLKDLLDLKILTNGREFLSLNILKVSITVKKGKCINKQNRPSASSGVVENLTVC